MRDVLVHAGRRWLNAALSLVYPEWCQICDSHPAQVEDGFVCEACRGCVKLVMPPFCEICGRPYAGQIEGSFVCSQCLEERHSFSFARSAALAEGVVLEAIHRYKYRGAVWLEPFLGKLLVTQAADSLTVRGWDAIVPVPLHKKKEREREFNQAARLGRRLSRATGIAMRGEMLRRVMPTRTQTRLTRVERFENMRGAFAIRNRAVVDGLRIVLVDDVFTTGATSGACAEVLRRAGAAEVCVWTVARGT